MFFHHEHQISALSRISLVPAQNIVRPVVVVETEPSKNRRSRNRELESFVGTRVFLLLFFQARLSRGIQESSQSATTFFVTSFRKEFTVVAHLSKNTLDLRPRR